MPFDSYHFSLAQTPAGMARTCRMGECFRLHSVGLRASSNTHIRTRAAVTALQDNLARLCTPSEPHLVGRRTPDQLVQLVHGRGLSVNRKSFWCDTMNVSLRAVLHRPASPIFLLEELQPQTRRLDDAGLSVLAHVLSMVHRRAASAVVTLTEDPESHVDGHREGRSVIVAGESERQPTE